MKSFDEIVDINEGLYQKWERQDGEGVTFNMLLDIMKKLDDIELRLMNGRLIS